MNDRPKMDPFYVEQADTFNALVQNNPPTAPATDELDSPRAWVDKRIEQVTEWCDTAGIKIEGITLNVHPDAWDAFPVKEWGNVGVGTLPTDLADSVDTFELIIETDMFGLDSMIVPVIGFMPVGTTGIELLQGIETRYVLQREGMGGDDAREAGKLL